ncbi:glycerol-3-phosphate dehydrogenase [Bradyrhizobium lablabi]|uniref:Glycerol-3-phosphate dehydrogenase n=1 Tax=Bradyrhizobium lablabi TaxID=722472 RepID=A0A1M6QJF1_9BRAD|nr:glycerol-3-phosphate dehydrogenase [Bradyrhizobium lablabi]SHK20298.1 glycerol-3-phosphate dehydrogenase [Bradyrhizobium lablabi]
MADYDLAIIGGGLNGVSVARDAAGRGLRVILLEQGDLGGAASQATSRMIHGDLAVLERWRFRRVRAALAEREIWLKIAPHLVRPMRFVIPAHADERPPWLLRAGLLLYDRLAARGLPPSATVDVTHHPVGNALKRPFGTAFEYSDCVVDDSRLVIANAVDAAERGAIIRTGARCVRADRTEIWRLAAIDRGHRQVITARALANASGAWTSFVAETVLRMSPWKAGTGQISQIVVRRLFDTDNVYVFQNADRRLIYACPFERDFTLIGSVGHAFKGDPAVVAIAAGDVAYLCDAANRYFRERIDASDVIRTFSGANLVTNPRRAARDGTMMFDTRRRKAPLLTIFGGDVTTSRWRAERAVSELTPFYPMSPRWTATKPLPGGDFAWDRFEIEVERARERWRFLSEPEAQRLVAAYGTRLEAILGDAKGRADLGSAFGPELTGAEVRYLMAKEWARFPDDILWRRSKLGLTMPPADRDALAKFMAGAAPG